MGKKKSRSSSSDVDLASLSTVSLDGRSTAAGGRGRGRGDDGDDDAAALADPFEAAVEALYEKRAATRLAALGALARMMERAWAFEDAAFKRAELTSLCLGCVRRGAPAEAAAAARLLALHAVTLGGASDAGEAIFVEAAPVLAPLVGAPRGGAPAAAAAEALALVTFVGAEDVRDTLDTMATLTKAWSSAIGGGGGGGGGRGGARAAKAGGGAAPAAAAASAAALRGWSLLLTTVPARAIDVAWVEAALAALGGCLRAADVEERAAAGEAAALLLHVCGLAGGALLAQLEAGGGGGGGENGVGGGGSGGDCSDGDDSDDGDGAGHLREGLDVNGNANLGGIVGRMRALAVNRGDAARRSRRDRAATRAAFRGLVAAVEGGAAGGDRAIRVKLRHGDALVIDDPPGRVRHGALRRALGEGLQAHLQANPLLHGVFGYAPRAERAERLTPAERRAALSPSSAGAKGRAQERRGARAAVAGYKNRALAADED